MIHVTDFQAVCFSFKPAAFLNVGLSLAHVFCLLQEEHDKAPRSQSEVAKPDSPDGGVFSDMVRRIISENKVRRGSVVTFWSGGFPKCAAGHLFPLIKHIFSPEN